MSLERNSPTPLYEQLKNIIETQIKKGNLKPYEQIPSERELCEKYGVSRITVRQAITLAEHQGLVHRTHGIGTFVNKQKIEQELTELNSFQTPLTQQGLIGSTKIIKSEVIQNTLQHSRLLNIGMDKKLTHLQLLGLGDDEPIVFYRSYFEHSIGTKMTKAAISSAKENIPFSTLDLYSKSLDLLPTQVEQTFEAKVSDEFLSDILHIKLGSPIFRVESLVYSGDQPIEYKEAHYCGDKYKFFVKRLYDQSNFPLE